jgi:hypothetical protein
MTLHTGVPGAGGGNPPALLTVAEVQQAVPANMKGHITQAFVDQINNLVQDPILAEQIRNNFISYARVMQEGKFKTEDYLNAVTYVSYKLMGYNNEESYCKTFPARHQALVAKGTSQKDISAYVSAYNRGKLVNLIMEQSLVPSWVLNQDIYQEAINTQAQIMRTALSDKVRSDAANSILTHLGKPKDANFQISMEVNENSGMTELKSMLVKLAETQEQAIQNGVGVRDITAQPLIDVTPTEVKSDNGES